MSSSQALFSLGQSLVDLFINRRSVLRIISVELELSLVHPGNGIKHLLSVGSRRLGNWRIVGNGLKYGPVAPFLCLLERLAFRHLFEQGVATIQVVALCIGHKSSADLLAESGIVFVALPVLWVHLLD